MIKKISFVLMIAAICVVGTAIAMMTVFKPEEKTVLAVSTDPKEDVNVTEIALKKIQKEVNITSSNYLFSYHYSKGKPNENASFSEKAKYKLTGRSLSVNAFLNAELRVNLLSLNEHDITYDEKKKSIVVRLPEPELAVHLNKEETKIDESFEAIFSSGFTEEERLRIYLEIEQIGKQKIIEEQTPLLEEGKEDIKHGLEMILSSIDEIETIYVTFY